MAIIFSKSSGAANDYWNESADMIQMKMKDTDNEKNKDDELVSGMFNVRKSKRFGEKIAGLSTFSNFEAVDEGAAAVENGGGGSGGAAAGAPSGRRGTRGQRADGGRPVDAGAVCGL